MNFDSRLFIVFESIGALKSLSSECQFDGVSRCEAYFMLYNCEDSCDEELEDCTMTQHFCDHKRERCYSCCEDVQDFCDEKANARSNFDLSMVDQRFYE